MIVHEPVDPEQHEITIAQVRGVNWQPKMSANGEALSLPYMETLLATRDRANGILVVQSLN